MRYFFIRIRRAPNEELQEGARYLSAEAYSIPEVKDEEFMVQKTYTTVSHPVAVVINSKSALVTRFTVF